MAHRIYNIPDAVTFDIDENTRIKWNAIDNRATIEQISDGEVHRVNITFENVNKIKSVLGDIDMLLEYAINHKQKQSNR